MLLQSWLGDLQSPDAAKRLEAALILGTLDDAWTFSADAGDEIILVTNVPEEDLYPRLFLYSPDNILLAARADEFSVAINAPLALKLPETGRYTVVVSAPLFDTSYELILQCVPQLGG